MQRDNHGDGKVIGVSGQCGLPVRENIETETANEVGYKGQGQLNLMACPSSACPSRSIPTETELR